MRKAHENIRLVREGLGVSKTFVANNLGMTLNGYSLLERGISRLDVERMKRIACILNVNSSVFLDDSLTDSVISRISDTA